MKQFRLTDRRDIPVLQATLEQYVEPELDVRHYHLATQEQELAFLVAFPTVPDVSDGRAHILEHLALCGSERFPVADPFFAMTRRSTATFMNAMTYADRTVYPFATTDQADFFNLLDVYLDATFWPKLDYLSFRQEGWRYANENGKLAYQGVVYNEMKGTYSNSMRALAMGVGRQLLEGTTYAVDSGGDPLDIPGLTHEMLKEFHATHYHPSQAIFMTAGRIPAAEVQARIIERVLSRTSTRSQRFIPELAEVWNAPRYVELQIPAQPGSTNEFGVQMAWRLGESRDQLEMGRIQLMATALLGDASAPLMKAMQSAGFGRPSRLNGFDTSARQAVFHLGMEGLTEAQVEPATRLIQRALQEAAEHPASIETLKSALRDMRVQMREVRGGFMPDALSRLMGAVPVVLCGGDAVDALDRSAAIETLEREIEDSEFFVKLVRKLLIDPARVVVNVRPDAEFHTKRQATEQERLAELDAKLSDDDRRSIDEENLAIARHREKGKDTSKLPRIAPKDVSLEPREVPENARHSDIATTVSIPSNGVAYATVLFNASSLDAKDWPWLALLADVLPQLGAGNRSYEEASAWRRKQVPSFNVYLDVAPGRVADQLTIQLGFAASGLVEEQAGMIGVIGAWAENARFDELDRIEFLVRSRTERILKGIAEAGDQYASMAASAPFSVRRRFQHDIYGAGAIEFQQSLKTLLQQHDGVRTVAEHLARLHRLTTSSRANVIWAASEGDLEASAKSLALRIDATAGVTQSLTTLTAKSSPANLAYLLPGQVNHCYLSWSVPRMDHSDAPALSVAAELISQQVLHRRLREQGGAYGGSAGYSEEDGIFAMSSFRDPRLTETYKDFDGAIDEVLETDYARETLEEAIISVIKRMDKPLAPQQRAVEAFKLDVRGITGEMRRTYRRAVLGCTQDDVRRGVAKWLKAGQSSRAAAVGRPDESLAGLSTVKLVG